MQIMLLLNSKRFTSCLISVNGVIFTQFREWIFKDGGFIAFILTFIYMSIFIIHITWIFIRAGMLVLYIWLYILIRYIYLVGLEEYNKFWWEITFWMSLFYIQVLNDVYACQIDYNYSNMSSNRNCNFMHPWHEETNT